MAKRRKKSGSKKSAGVKSLKNKLARIRRIVK